MNGWIVHNNIYKMFFLNRWTSISSRLKAQIGELFLNIYIILGRSKYQSISFSQVINFDQINCDLIREEVDGSDIIVRKCTIEMIVLCWLTHHYIIYFHHLLQQARMTSSRDELGYTENIVCKQKKDSTELCACKKTQMLEIFHLFLFSCAKEHNPASEDRFCSQRKTFTQHLEIAAPHPRLPISL